MRVIIYLLMIMLSISCTSQPKGQTSAVRAEKNSEAAALNTDLGAKYLSNGDYQLAEDKLLRALKQNPNHAPTHWTYALLQERLGRYELAEQYFRSALVLDANDSKGKNNFGTFLCKQKRYQEADEYFKQALSDPLYASKVSANLNAGVCAMEIPEYSLAENYFQSVLDLEPGNRVALYQMAKAHFSVDALIEARGYIKGFERVSQHTSKSLWLAYRIEKGLGNTPEANTYARRLEQTFPTSKEADQLAQVRK